MKKKMRRILALILIEILCFVLMQYLDWKLSDLENIIIAECIVSYTPWQRELIENYVNIDRNIEMFSAYSDYSGNLKTSRHSYNNISVCMVDEKFADFCNMKMVNGRFIRNGDVNVRNNYIVIEKDMASALFSTPDCIGKEVELGKKTFTVVGIYEKSNWLVATMSAISSNTVFIPYIFTEMPERQNALLRQVFLFRVKNNVSAVMTEPIWKNLEKILNTNVNMENIDMKARQVRQKIKAIYFFIACITIMYLLKWVIPVLKRIYGQLREEMNNFYFIQILKKNWLKLVVFLFVTFGLIAVVFLAIDNLRPELIIDPELIPSRLINTRELAKKISDYFIKVNTEQFIVSSFHAFVNHANRLQTYLGGILILCWWRVLHNLAGKDCLREAGYNCTGEKVYGLYFRE